MNNPAESQKGHEILCGIIVSVQAEKRLVVVRSRSHSAVLVMVDLWLLELGFRLGDAWRYHGSNEVHPTFGDIFRAIDGHIVFPDEDLIPHFIAMNVSGISQKCSKRLWTAHSKQLVYILDKGDWQTLINTSGCRLSLRLALAVIQKWNFLKAEFTTIAYFHSIFLTTVEAEEFNKLYSARSCEIIKRNPYALLSVANFERVDNIALKYFGIDRRDSIRTNAAIRDIFSLSYQSKQYFLDYKDLIARIRSYCKISESSSAYAIRCAVESGYLTCKDGLYYSKPFFRIGQLMRRLVIAKAKPIEGCPISSSISAIITSHRQLYSATASIIAHAKACSIDQVYFLSHSSTGYHPNVSESELIHVPTLDLIDRQGLKAISKRLFIIADSANLGIGEACRLLSSLRDEELIVFLTLSNSDSHSLLMDYILQFQIPLPIIPLHVLTTSNVIYLQPFESSLEETKQLGNMIVSEVTQQEEIAFNLWFFIVTRWRGSCVIVSLSDETHEKTKEIATHQIQDLGSFTDFSEYHHSTNVQEFNFTLLGLEKHFDYPAHESDLAHDFKDASAIDRTILILKREDSPDLDQIRNLVRRTQKQLIVVGDANTINSPFRIWNHREEEIQNQVH